MSRSSGFTPDASGPTELVDGRVRRSGSSSPDAGATGTEAEPQIWAGQLWALAPVLCDPDETQGLQQAMISAEGHTDRVVLSLKSDADAGWHGDIRFGEGVLPERPDKEDLNSNTGLGGVNGGKFLGCSWNSPAKGGDYTLLAVSWRSDALILTIAFNEIWNDWCQREKFMCNVVPAACNGFPTCICQDDECSADLSRVFRIELASTGDKLEGPMRIGARADTSAQLRLLRVQ
jgi:hypothetical protein